MSGHDSKRQREQGPFRADGLEPDGYYEISRGHPVQLSPAGTRHGNANVTGALPLATDPMVVELGVDVGHELAEDTVRAPDVSVGGVPADKGGWAKGAPPLAVEYADEGTKEADLQTKIEEYFGAGSKFVWVVRLVGLRRVEVYSSPGAVVTYTGDELIEAPGILQEKLPAAALWDRRVALDVSMRNLLIRAGYKTIDQVREEGREQGIEQGIERGQLALIVAGLEAKLGRALIDGERERVTAELRAGRALVLLDWLSLAPEVIEERLRRLP
jgi:Uma2 family endonuclease